MKLGDIKIEALKIMFVNYNTDLTIDELDNAMQDENYGSYLVNMPGAIIGVFRCLKKDVSFLLSLSLFLPHKGLQVAHLFVLTLKKS